MDGLVRVKSPRRTRFGTACRMADAHETQIQQRISSGDDQAFEAAYTLFDARVRAVAWRIVRRADWLDEIVNEAWSRAYTSRTSYDAERPFVVWMAGIVQNVQREHARASPTTLGDVSPEADPHGASESNGQSPETLVSEAEVMLALNDCFNRLGPEDARIIRLRYFQNMTYRSVAQEVGIAESTLREHRIPDALEQLRRCLQKKGVEIPQLFSAQTEGLGQLQGEV